MLSNAFNNNKFAENAHNILNVFWRSAHTRPICFHFLPGHDPCVCWAHRKCFHLLWTGDRANMGMQSFSYRRNAATNYPNDLFKVDACGMYAELVCASEKKLAFLSVCASVKDVFEILAKARTKRKILVWAFALKSWNSLNSSLCEHKHIAPFSRFNSHLKFQLRRLQFPSTC